MTAGPCGAASAGASIAAAGASTAAAGAASAGASAAAAGASAAAAGAASEAPVGPPSEAFNILKRAKPSMQRNAIEWIIADAERLQNEWRRVDEARMKASTNTVEADTDAVHGAVWMDIYEDSEVENSSMFWTY